MGDFRGDRPGAGGSLAQYASWRWIFPINLPLGAAAVALLARYLHENVQRTRHRIDVAGAAAIFVARSSSAWSRAAWRGRGGPGRASRCSRSPGWPPRLPCSPSGAPRSRSCHRGSGAAGCSAAPRWPLGLGLLVIGPTTFLPTYGQAVLGLGAVAAGAVLGAMSIGWPLAPALSAKLFLRVGFRDTQLTGAAICLVVVAAFLFAPDPAPLWQPVLETFVLAAASACSRWPRSSARRPRSAGASAVWSPGP